MLRYLGDLSVNETGQVMGCSPGAVKQHCSRGLAGLAETIRDEERGDLVPLAEEVHNAG